MLKIIFIMFFTLVFLTAKAQERRGLVIDAKTNKPVAYTTVKVLHNPMGAIATERGAFAIDSKQADTVQFSSVGYKSKWVAGKDMTDTIYLEPAPQTLKEIRLQTRKWLRTLILGFDKADLDNKMSWGPGGKAEFAQKIDLPDRNRCYQLKKIDVRIKKHGCYGPLLLHIYAIDTATGGPGEEWITKPVYFNGANVKKNKGTIDVSEDRVFLLADKSFFIGFSWLPGAENQQCLTTMFLSQAGSSNLFSRTVMSNNYDWFPFYWGKDANGNPLPATTIISAEVDELN